MDVDAVSGREKRRELQPQPARVGEPKNFTHPHHSHSTPKRPLGAYIFVTRKKKKKSPT